MNHLSDEQLSARLDDTLPARERANCDEHLAGCEACRARLAKYSELDISLGRALTHDPGEAYFADFAERVGARIAAESGAGARAAAADARPAARRSPWGWLLSPRGLTLAGSTAALVLAAGVAWMRFRGNDDVTTALRESAGGPSATMSDQAAPAPTATQPAEPEPDSAKLQSSPGPQAPQVARREEPVATALPSPAASLPTSAGATRAREAQLEAGEGQASRAIPPAAGSGARLDQRESQEPAKSLAAEMKRRALQPAQEKVAARDELQKNSLAAPAPSPPAASFRAPAPSAARAQPNAMPQSIDVTSELESPCGTVRDTRGQPIAGAQIAAVSGDAQARGAKSGADGRFCLPSLRVGDTLSVLRVGYEALRIVVGPATSLALALEPVGTLGPQAGGLAIVQDAPPRLTEGDDASKLGFTRRTPVGHSFAPAADVYAEEPAAIRVAVADARRLITQARRERTASSYEKAAERWERIGTLTSGTAGFDARFQGLGALREAWRLEPIPARATRLRARLVTFLAAVPDTLPERDTALRWQRELGDR